ncbi:MAG: hypothetical protein OGMRLDGQ_001884 [Candidatus Fervidibacter sp.]
MVKQDIFEPMPSHPMAHASTLSELPDGKLLCAFYAGTYETAPDQAIFIAQARKRADGFWEWTSPRKLIDTPRKADGNPVLFTSPDGTVWLFFVTLQGTGWSSSLLFAAKSLDGGETWSEPQLLSAVRGTMPRTKPLVLRDGAWLLPLYDEIRWRPIFWRSEDNGQTWREFVVQTRRQLIQPAVVELSERRNSLATNILAVRRQRTDMAGVCGSNEASINPACRCGTFGRKVAGILPQHFWANLSDGFGRWRLPLE